MKRRPWDKVDFLPLPLFLASLALAHCLYIHSFVPTLIDDAHGPTMASKLLNLVALSSLAILACSFSAAPVSALHIADSSLHARSFNHHNIMAKKKRAETRRCKQRGESSSAAPTPSASASGSPTAGASSPPASPNPPPPAAPPANPPPSTAGGGKVCLAWNNGNQDKIGNFVTPKVGL